MPSPILVTSVWLRGGRAGKLLVVVVVLWNEISHVERPTPEKGWRDLPYPSADWMA